MQDGMLLVPSYIPQTTSMQSCFAQKDPVKVYKLLQTVWTWQSFSLDDLTRILTTLAHLYNLAGCLKLWFFFLLNSNNNQNTSLAVRHEMRRSSAPSRQACFEPHGCSGSTSTVWTSDNITKFRTVLLHVAGWWPLHTIITFMFYFWFYCFAFLFLLLFLSIFLFIIIPSCH